MIDRAIDGRTVRNFVTYRAERDLDARGGSLKHPAVEIGTDELIEDFLLDDSFASIGVVDCDHLCDRLTDAIQPENASESERTLMNLCFDALACIRELESCLAREANANEQLRYALTQESELRRRAGL